MNKKLNKTIPSIYCKIHELTNSVCKDFFRKKFYLFLRFVCEKSTPEFEKNKKKSNNFLRLIWYTMYLIKIVPTESGKNELLCRNNTNYQQ